jgi:alpha-glucosidase
VHDVLRHWRDIAETYDPPRLLLGETPVEDSVALGAFYGPELDELQLAFNFPFINAAFDALAMPAVVESTYAALPDGAWPAWTGSNHDMSRFATRWAHGDEPKVRAALVMLLGVRGTPVLYQGDEIGQRDTEVDPKDFRDPLGVRYWPAYAGRDAMRTPMQWGGEPGAGFTEPDVRPWLPFGDLSCNVAHQRGDRTSTLHLTRDLLALRRATPDLTLGNYTRLAAPDGVWAWRRGEHHAVAINCSDAPATVDGLGGRVLIASDRALDDTAIAASLSLPAWTAAIVRVDP